jgi:hypothetical protein
MIEERHIVILDANTLQEGETLLPSVSKKPWICNKSLPGMNATVVHFLQSRERSHSIIDWSYSIQE